MTGNLPKDVFVQISFVQVERRWRPKICSSLAKLGRETRFIPGYVHKKRFQGLKRCTNEICAKKRDQTCEVTVSGFRDCCDSDQ